MHERNDRADPHDTAADVGSEPIVGFQEDGICELLALLERAACAGPTHASHPESIAADDAALIIMADRVSRDQTLAEMPLAALASLAERCIYRLTEAGGDVTAPARVQAWELLDSLGRSAVLRRMAADDTAVWTRRILDLVERSHFTFGPLLTRRAATYGAKTLFVLPEKRARRRMSWREVSMRVDALARGFLALETASEADEPARVAILSENSIEMALVDLACLSSGIVDVMIPGNATPEDVGYILGHAQVSIVVVSTRRQLDKVRASLEHAPQSRLETIITMDSELAGQRGTLSLETVEALAEKTPFERLEHRRRAVRIDELATVMYTSGTTGTPKGIQFCQRNIVFKRFARAMALPEIGDEDVFLCYLPLFHTFGRFLEMTGCVFWGATYCFLDNPSFEALLDGMRRFRPTVFISIPKRWVELYDGIRRAADLEVATDDEVQAAARSIVGDRLRWGVSAAGYLDPEIFRFFQRQGVELMSGFGMTEATGGITMTPPQGYREDSLGRALPGVEIRLAGDGELLVRGPYIMMGYLDPPDGESSFDDDGWLATGDIMEADDLGYIRLVDRKKDIYKNIKGETVAPQKVENLFRDFDSVGRVFLVGDHREYNTALIYPNMSCEEADLATMTESERHDHFGSLVESVNKFLAPFERIVDFALIHRDFSADRGELTPKGTYRRLTIERNFADTMRWLYRTTTVRVGGLEVRVPNWLFQACGLIAQSLTVSEEEISLMPGRSLIVRRHGRDTIQVGTALYGFRERTLRLGRLIGTPVLWMGNQALTDFVPLEPSRRVRLGRRGQIVGWLQSVEAFEPSPQERERFETICQRAQPAQPAQPDLMDLHLVARMLDSVDDNDALDAVELLGGVVSREEGSESELARGLLRRCGVMAESGPSIEARRRAFQILAVTERPDQLPTTLERFLRGPAHLLDSETADVVCERGLDASKLDAFIAAAERCVADADAAGKHKPVESSALQRAESILQLIAAYGSAHPASYRKLRAVLARLAHTAEVDPVRATAERAVVSLREGFRRWLGRTSRIAVDRETGREYRWRDVVGFDSGVEPEVQSRIMSAIRNTQMVGEAIFLFSGGVSIQLSDIPLEGVWIRHLGTNHGKSVCRITVQTRGQESYDFAVNVNRTMSKPEVLEEARWLVLCGSSRAREPVVEDFGGYWPDQDLWTEEFIAGETLTHAVRRLAKRNPQRLEALWPFFAWSAIGAYVDFWDRTGRRLEAADPANTDVIVPTHDYQTGARLVAISPRRQCTDPLALVRRLRARLVVPVEAQHPELAGSVGWPTVLSALLEVIGESEGVRLLRAALRGGPGGTSSDMDVRERALCETFLDDVERRGIMPMRLFFAVERFRRWARLADDATPEAGARTLQDLYETYGLARVADSRPQTRVRFFRETVLENVHDALASGLDELIDQLRSGSPPADALSDGVADLRARLSLSSEDDYFMTRLSFPYLRPEDEAGFVSSRFAGGRQAEMVVTLEDADGEPFQVRHAINPKEVGRLHRLFIASKLDIRFRPEHQFLVAISPRGHLTGGLVYEINEDAVSAHLEKIVVGERYRGRGTANGIMHELFNRLRTSGVKSVTTGFFRPHFFYSFGFTIERRYAGLVKKL